MDNPKPCPFCGNFPIIQQDRRYPGNSDGVDAFEIVCNTFGCVVYHADNTYFRSIADAIRAWNRRV